MGMAPKNIMENISLPDRGQFHTSSSYFFVFIVWAIGGLMLGLGVYNYIHILDMGSVVNEELAPLVMVITVIGGVLFLTAMIGIVGICVKQSYLLSGFLAALIIICVVQFAVVVIMFMYDATLHYFLQDGMSHSLLFYGKSGENAKFTESWDYVQERYECCGKWGWADYATPNSSNWYSTNFGSLPDSCCKTIAEGCGTDVVDTDNLSQIPADVWTKGCYDVTQESLKDLLVKSGAAVLVFLVLEVVALFLNFSLYSKFKYDEGFRVKNKKIDKPKEDEESERSSEDQEEDPHDLIPGMPEVPALKL